MGDPREGRKAAFCICGAVPEASLITGQTITRSGRRNSAPSRPLFLYLDFTAPHTPYQAPEAWLERYAHVEDPERRAYAAMISAMDDQIGRVVAALDATGLRENTLIVFHSDNGGTRNRMFAGESAVEGHLPPREDMVYNVEPTQGAIRVGDWKLHWVPVLPPVVELFDLANDPGETTNVADAHPDIVVELQARVVDLARTIVPPLFYGNALATTLAAPFGDAGGPMTRMASGRSRAGSAPACARAKLR
jgi:arylsulfatase A-like enzyme